MGPYRSMLNAVGIIINLENDITTLLGGNGSGKTAALVALARMFGISRAQRSILKTDFHIGVGEDGLSDGAQITMEAVFEFPRWPVTLLLTAGPARTVGTASSVSFANPSMVVSPGTRT